jgi:hypothetical protein
MPTEMYDDIGRKYSDKRISAYECSLDVSGNLRQGSYITGWYGMFNEQRLRNELIPDIERLWIPKGKAYPLLITSHLLEKGTQLFIKVPIGRKAGCKDATFNRRQRKSPDKWVAVVLSPTEYKLL